MTSKPSAGRDQTGGGGGAAGQAAAGSRMAYGGKTVYGAAVGILMLDTHFPRVPGDLGNATTWPFPVLFKVVKGATPQRTNDERVPSILTDFIAAGRELVAQGADGLTTSCGFLSLYQDTLKAECGVPVAASSLLQVPLVEALLPPGQRAGVITANSKTLGVEHLEAAGARADTPVVGAQEIRGTWPPSRIPREKSEWDMALAEEEMLRAGELMLERHPNVGAIVLECTNMPPFSAALAHHIRRPVFDVYTMVTWFQAGLRPRAFGHPSSSLLPFRER